MMPKGKLSPEGEIIAAYGAAMVAAFQVLLNCLEENDAVARNVSQQRALQSLRNTQPCSLQWGR
jgi:hypothetical protein